MLFTAYVSILEAVNSIESTVLGHVDNCKERVPQWAKRGKCKAVLPHSTATVQFIPACFYRTKQIGRMCAVRLARTLCDLATMAAHDMTAHLGMRRQLTDGIDLDAKLCELCGAVSVHP